MKTNDKIGIVCCSNCLHRQEKAIVEDLIRQIENCDLKPVLSEYLFRDSAGRNPSGKDRASALMQMYNNSEIASVWDISGGDIANEVILHLDFKVIQNSSITYWGYSDNSTIANSIFSITGKKSILYQPKNFARNEGELPMKYLKSFLLNNSNNDLLNFTYHFVQGKEMQGTLIGGNTRCFLKLAGTPYFPDMTGKILLLEGWSGKEEQLITYFSQLKMLNVFEKINGILLGTFIQLEQESNITAAEILQRFIPADLPIAVTNEIGHAHTSKAAVIGGYLNLNRFQ